MRITGHYESIGSTSYFIPNSLPPKNPPLNLDHETLALYGETMLHIGKLKEMTNRLPDIERFIKAYVIKEAVLTSSIEGINTTVLDMFTQPLLESKPSKETQLVLNYTKALSTAIMMIKNGLPISSRIILETHKVLMETGEGAKAHPGHYRKQSVKVGELIPPPPNLVPNLMSDLESYINKDETASLIKAGLAHVQFETIHPFLDGNGRIGRLLILLIFIENELLLEPVLYPSFYFKKHQLEYYSLLNKVRTEGDFEGWITFYLKAIKYSCIDAHQRAKDIELLNEQAINLVNPKKLSTKAKQLRLDALIALFRYPIISISKLSSELNITYNTASQIIKEFLQTGLIIEESSEKRGKLFKFKQYIEILEKEYEK